MSKEVEALQSIEKQFVCQFCDKSFITLTKLKMHERIHTGEEPFLMGNMWQIF